MGEWNVRQKRALRTIAAMSTSCLMLVGTVLLSPGAFAVIAPCPGCGGGAAVSISVVSVNAFSKLGTVATITWSDSPSSASDSVYYTCTACRGSWIVNTVTPSGHQLTIKGMVPEDYMSFTITASASGYSSGTWTGNFHTNDAGVQPNLADEWTAQNPGCWGCPTVNMNGETQSPGDLIYNAYNATHYALTNTYYGTLLQYQGSGGAAWWPWSDGVKSIVVDLSIQDTTNAGDNLAWFTPTDIIFPSYGVSGLSTITWNIGGTSPTIQGAGINVGVSISSPSTPSYGLSVSNAYEGNGFKHMGSIYFDWPTATTTSFSVVWPWLINDQTAQWYYQDDFSFYVSWTYTYGTFTGTGWYSTQTYSVSDVMGGCVVASGPTYNLQGQCVALEQGTASSP